MTKGFSATTSKSVQNARKNLTKFLKTIDTVPLDVLNEEASRIYVDEIAHTPYRSGKLENSVYCRVSKDKRSPGIVTGASARSPGGYNYAGIQHENVTFIHPVKGTAHYIRDPFNRGVKRIKHKIARRLKYKT